MRVEGMRCHSCEQVLTAWLSDIRGIETVLANHTSGQVVIYADPDVPVDAILTAVIRAGFVPGTPTVLIGTDAAAAVEMPIEAERTDIGDVQLILQASAPDQSEDAGEPAEQSLAESSFRRLKLSALGMHCSACEKLVTAQALEVPGVAAAVGDAA